jgi:PST family polysaccharide transporter
VPGTLVQALRDRDWRRVLSHQLLQNALLLYGVQIGSYIFPLIALPYLTRILAPAKFGLITFAQSFIWYFLTLTEYGFNLTATRQIAVHRDDPDAVSGVFSAVMAAKLLLTIAGFVIMLGVVFATPKLRADWLLYVVSFLSVVGNLLFPVWFFQGMQRMGHLAVRDFAAKLLSLAAVFALVHRDSDYILAAGIQAGAMVVAGLAGLLSVRRVAPLRWTSPGWREVYGALRSSWAVFLSMAGLSLTASTNIFILGFVATPAEVGYYSAAYRVIVALRMLVSPIVTAIYPHISHMAASSKQNAVRFLKRYSLLLALPFFFVSVGLWIGAPLIVDILFGPRFAPTKGILRILAPQPFLLALSHNFSTFFMLAFGYDKQWSRIIFQIVILNLAILLLLLWVMPSASAVALTGTLLDGYSVAAAYWFYRRHSGSDGSAG